MKSKSSLVHGPTSVPLSSSTLGELIDGQSLRYRDKMQLIIPYQNSRSSFVQLSERSKRLAKAFLASGLKSGDKVGIFAANRYEYIDVILAAARIGCPSVVFNTTYTAQELYQGATFTRLYPPALLEPRSTDCEYRVQSDLHLVAYRQS